MADENDACHKSCDKQPKWLHYLSTTVVVILAMTLHPLVSPTVRSKIWSGRWQASPLHIPLQIIAAMSLAYSMTEHVGNAIATLVVYMLFRVTVLEMI